METTRFMGLGLSLEICAGPEWHGRATEHRFAAEIAFCGASAALGWGATPSEAALAAAHSWKESGYATPV